MKDIEKLQEMSKNGEISKKLLENEKFKNELKNFLNNKCNVEITDDDVSDMIKNLEIALQDETYLGEDELGAISGGLTARKKACLAGASIGGVAGAVGYIALVVSKWRKLASIMGRQRVVNLEHDMYLQKIHQKATSNSPTPTKLKAAAGTLGGGIGAGLGLGVAYLVCSALGVK